MNDPLPKTYFMVADIAGSAQLYEKLNDREAQHAVERCIKRMSRSVEAYKGNLIQVVADELLASFNTAELACQAAIDMHQRIDDLPPASGHKLNIRIGLHGGATAAGSALIGNTVRIVGIARGDQIVCSQRVVDDLPPSGVVKTIPRPELGALTEGEHDLALYQVHWPARTEGAPAHSMFGPMSAATITRLCVRHHGKALLLDEKTPVLTLGRDPGSKLLIDDRKASRQHARIERRVDGFYLVDTSTNGSFVRIGGRQEVLVRKHEMLLEGSGTICFGSSINDPGAERLEFEHL